MSSTSPRFVAATVAAIIAVLTGIAVGLVSPRTTCRVTAPSPPLPPAATPTAGVGDQAPPATSAAGRPTLRQVTCTVDRFDVAPAVVGVIGGLGAGAAVFAMLLAADRRRLAATPPAGPGSPAPSPGRHPRSVATGTGDRTGAPAGRHRVAVPAAGATRVEADRAALIRACIYVRDRTTSPALADRLGTALRDAGVRTVEPAGARFDPARHEAGAAAPCGDPAKVGTIAAVEVPGYTDRDGRQLRVPVVTVFRAATATEREDR
jgi:hypothetical protein